MRQSRDAVHVLTSFAPGSYGYFHGAPSPQWKRLAVSEKGEELPVRCASVQNSCPSDAPKLVRTLDCDARARRVKCGKRLKAGTRAPRQSRASGESRIGRRGLECEARPLNKGLDHVGSVSQEKRKYCH